MSKTSLKAAIMQAALKAFANADYKNVSTNDIVKHAGVSKGLLFHYFKSKETLYIHLYESALDMIEKEIFERFDDQETDLFERLKTMIVMKSHCLQQHKMVASFLKRVHLNQDPRITQTRVKLFHAFTNRNYKHVFKDYDHTKFVDSSYLEEINKVVTWTFHRITNEWERTHYDKDPKIALRILENDLTHYIDFFVRYFYKKDSSKR